MSEETKVSDPAASAISDIDARRGILEPVRSVVAALVNAGRSPEEAIGDVRAVLDGFAEELSH